MIFSAWSENMNPYLDLSEEVSDALRIHMPIVALESTIITHGMPWPQNLETAVEVEEVVREEGAVPATIAIIGGRLKVGLSHDELRRLADGSLHPMKASRRDIPLLVAQQGNGATTVAGTMLIAEMAGIHLFATGGIGGVHRGAEKRGMFRLIWKNLRTQMSQSYVPAPRLSSIYQRQWSISRRKECRS